MFTAIRFRHMAIVGVLCCVVFPGSKVSAQLYCSPDWTPEYKCLEHCGPCAGTSSGGASGGNYGGAIGEIIGLPGDIIRAHNKAKAVKEAKKLTALNDQGVAAYDKKDWATAEAEFKKALKLNPNDHVYLRNLGMTQGHEGEDAYRKGDYTTALNYFQQALANDPADDPDKHTLIDDLATVQGKIAAIRHEQEQRQQDKIAASKMQQSIQNLAQSLTAAPSSNTAPSSGGLDFNDGKAGNNSDKSSGLTFMTTNPAAAGSLTQPGTGGTTNAFGTASSNPSGPSSPLRPNLQPVPLTPTGTDTNALHLGKAAAGTSTAGEKASDEETAARLAGKTFDRGGGDQNDIAAAPVVSVSTPTAEPVLPPRVAQALAADKEYLAVTAHRAQAVSDAAAAQQQLNVLNTHQNAETSPQQRQQNQIKISEVTRQLDLAKSKIVVDDIKRDDITKRVIYTVTILPASPEQNKGTPQPQKQGAQPAQEQEKK